LPRFVLHRGVLTGPAKGQSLIAMDPDDLLPKTLGDPLAVLARQDLDPLSVDELHARIAALQAEIARCQGRIATAVNHKATAEGLFKR
jgi:uncharacterized small protein (DUF1192 family)